MKIALFEPQIPENTGNILRTATCFNLEVNIIMPCGFNFGNKKMNRATMDYITKADYKLFPNWERFLSENKNARLVLATTKAKKYYYDFAFEAHDILLFGNETRGVADFIAKEVTHKIKIPLCNNMRSFNLSVAVGIITSFALYQTKAFLN